MASVEETDISKHMEKQVLEIAPIEITPEDVKHDCQTLPAIKNEDEPLISNGSTSHQLNEKKSRCTECNKVFHRPSDLQVHMRKHATPKQCTECDKKFTNAKALSMHMRIHTGERPFQCPECDKKFSRKGILVQHMSIHGEKDFQCTECDQAFFQNRTLFQHMILHHRINKPFKCPECDMAFTHQQIEQGDLLRHMETHTPVCEITPKALKQKGAQIRSFGCDIKLSVGNGLTGQSHTETTFQCTKCPRTFSHAGHLKQHMRLHTGYNLYKPFQCTECDNTFSWKDDLESHMKIHTRYKPFQCTSCDLTFSCKDNLDSHMRIHTGYKPFQCTECDKIFFSIGHLNQHKRVHTEKIYTCTHCNKICSTRNILKIHTRVHTGERPYPCTECDKAFSQKSSLQKHFETIHTGYKPFQCTECDKTLKTTFTLSDHMRIHKRHTGERPLSCLECDKKFKTTYDLSNHIKTHNSGDTGERAFECPLCKLCCATKGQLVIHMAKHTEERPLPCQESDTEFTKEQIEQGDIFKHMETHRPVHEIAPTEFTPEEYVNDNQTLSVIKVEGEDVETLSVVKVWASC